MSTRKELPWPTISREVISAIRSCNNGRKFVNSGKVAMYIHDNTGSYPHFSDCTYRTTIQRIATSLNKKGWKKFNQNCKKPGVFIDPSVVDEITDGAVA